MSIKIARLADRVIEDLQNELDGMSKDDLSTFNHDRFINENIDMQMPTSNWEFIEFLQDDTDLGFESDLVTPESIGNTGTIFRFIQLRIHEELTREVHDRIDPDWLDVDTCDQWDSPPTPDNFFDDGEALASAGWGTDEDFGMASEML